MRRSQPAPAHPPAPNPQRMDPRPMRKLNVKLLLCVLGGALALSVLLAVVHALPASSIGNGLLWQADQAEKAGQLDQTVRYLKRYLEFSPSDSATRARLGMTMADPKVAVSPSQRQRARFVLEGILSREPDRHEVRRCLVRLAL